MKQTSKISHGYTTRPQIKMHWHVLNDKPVILHHHLLSTSGLLPIFLLFVFLNIWAMLCATGWSVPGFQRDVAVQDPAVMEMHWILRTGGGSRGSRTGLAAGGHWSSLERIGCWRWFSGAGACVRWWRWRREGSEGELVVWATWHIWNNKEKAKKHTECYYLKKKNQESMI